MEIQTKPVFKTRTPRVKCITSHPSFPDVLVCLFTGELRLYDPKTFSLKKSAQVCDSPIRTAVIVPSKDWILVGNDNGCLLVVDLGNLSVLETIKAHDDFIRKVVVDENNQRIITVSDDNRTKLWSFSDGIVMVNKYKDAKHFVMDACLYPSDNNRFFTASLDGKIRMYSVTSTKLLRVFKGHEKGVNSITFVSPETFITGADDCTVRVWDVGRQAAIAVLKGHTKNVNAVRTLRNGFASCSEDDTVRFWTSDFKMADVVSMQGRVWDAYLKDSRIFVGSDEELCVFQEVSTQTIALLRENKIFYNVGNTVFSVKTDELGAYKELGSIDESFDSFTVSPNGKLLGVMANGEVSVNSTLGMRRKYTDSGRDLCFIDSDTFVYLKNKEIITVVRNEVESKLNVGNIQRILCANSKHIIVNTGKTAIYTVGSDSPLKELDVTVQRATIMRGYFILFGDQIHIYNRKVEKVATLDHSVVNFIQHDDILYFSTPSKTLYLILHKDEIHIAHLRYYGNLIGVWGNRMFYFANGIKTDVIDAEFIGFKRDFLSGIDLEPAEGFRDKAISFFESLGLHEKALSMCSDENQRFEILIKLNRLEDALKTANSPIKYEKLGRKFLSLQDFVRASECFKNSNDLDSLFLTDIFGEKRYLGYVASKARETGRDNLALLAAYKAKDYRLCADLLKDTPFHRAFAQTYLQ